MADRDRGPLVRGLQGSMLERGMRSAQRVEAGSVSRPTAFTPDDLADRRDGSGVGSCR